jgi:hypothetical protein
MPHRTSPSLGYLNSSVTELNRWQLVERHFVVDWSHIEIEQAGARIPLSEFENLTRSL